jgi:hypothetical protein
VELGLIDKVFEMLEKRLFVSLSEFLLFYGFIGPFFACISELTKNLYSICLLQF